MAVVERHLADRVPRPHRRDRLAVLDDPALPERITTMSWPSSRCLRITCSGSKLCSKHSFPIARMSVS